MAGIGEFDDIETEYPKFISKLTQGMATLHNKLDNVDKDGLEAINAFLLQHFEQSQEDDFEYPPKDDIAHIWETLWRTLEIPGPGNITRERIKQQYPWQIWRGEKDEHFLNVGLDGCITTTLSVDHATTMHQYAHIPSVPNWKLIPTSQGGKKFFVGSLRISEIDAICSVPSMPNQEEARETASWVVNPKKGENTWQRKMDKSRVLSIRTFADSSENNLILNSIMLYIPPSTKGISVDTNTGEISIDFEHFLEKIGEVYFDSYTTEEGDFSDKRPIWILDGQHHRGLALSVRGCELHVPVIVMLGGEGEGAITLADAAKLFTEINTLSESLDDL